MPKYAAIIVLLIFTASCGMRQTPAAGVYGSAHQADSSGGEAGNLNKKIFRETASKEASSSGSVNHSNYTIGPSDLLEIKAMESEKFGTTERVDAAGNIKLPLLNEVAVGGMTPVEAEVRIETLLKERGFIKDPHVNVFVAEHQSKRVSVLGYVNEPGNYEIIGEMTLLDALAMAKGLDADAGTLVYVTRKNADSQEKVIVDLDDMLKREGTANEVNFELAPGDKVYVPEASNVFVDGAVRTPGSYPINEGETTVSQAIVMAGGLLSYANAGDVSLVRDLGDGRKEVVKLDMDNINQGTGDDPILGEKDAIVVGASGLKSFFYGLNLNVFGFGGVGYNPPAR
jgi:polysaccharide export outer membrane protein